MAEVLPDNGLTSTLNGSITNVQTTLTIQSADASIFPGSGEYRAVLWQDLVTGPWELVKVTGGQGTATLTVERATEPYHGVQSAQAWTSGTGIAAVLTQDGIDALLVRIRSEEFVPANAATTVTLSRTPETVFMVARNGVVQSLGAGHYSVSVATLTFAASFNGSDRVIVAFSVRGP